VPVLQVLLKKKGPLAMSKRPKSREETPKEGSDSARRYRTATICDRAAQNARAFTAFPMQNPQGTPARNSFKTSNICNIFQRLTEQPASAAINSPGNSSNLSLS
jgi:hypothetical protein